MAQGQPGFGQKVQSAIGDISAYFRKPNELSEIPSNQQQQNNDGQASLGPKGAPPQQQQQQQGKQPAGATNSGATNDPETLQNPLDVYKGLFDNSPKLDKDGNPIKAIEAPSFKLDPKTVTDAAGKIDFMSGLPQEVQDKLQSGQIDSQTLSAVVQHAGQTAYARAMEHSSTLTDRFVGMRTAHEQQGLPAQVKRLLAQSQVASNPAIASNPALKEHYEFITDKLHGKFPDQSPEWIATQANQYFTDMAKAVNPKLGERNTNDEGSGKQHTNSKGETVSGTGEIFDWQAYLKE